VLMHCAAKNVRNRFENHTNHANGHPPNKESMLWVFVLYTATSSSLYASMSL